jgi:hypothetical protein
MLVRRAARLRSAQCRSYSQQRIIRPVASLSDATVKTFRADAFEPAVPALLPRGTFSNLPATTKWFINGADGSTTINRSYLARYGSTIVPLEISNDARFTRTEQSLSFFLECVHASSSSSTRPRPSRYFSAYVPGAKAVKRTKKSNNFFSATTVPQSAIRVYLAQAAIAGLPQGLKDDVPTPEYVLSAGKGDVYDSSIWLGEAPTFTPLHRDPNPNLFVQVAGTKVVRLLNPEDGRALFAKVQEKIGGSAAAAIRGEEMMHGAEKKALEDEVWANDNDSANGTLLEAKLDPGDGLFIPKGWWHSVKGIGTGMTGSVNWWFR